MTSDDVRVAANVARHAQRALRQVGDERGAREAQAAERLLRAPRVRLVVAGEFQQGKSSCVNALMGARISPTEPLSTTSTPIRLSWGEQASWQAHVDGDAAGPALLAIDPSQVDDVATTQPPLLDGRIVTGIEVRMDHPLLRAGVGLIDTPCVSGGLSTQTAGLVLGLLQEADGLVFVTDASQELTAPELEFLRMARSICPSLVVLLSKIDLYPEWRRILDIDQAYIAPIDPDAVVLPVSPHLRAAAVRWQDPELDRASGLPLVSWYLATTMLTQARQAAMARSANMLAARLASTSKVVEERLAVLDRSTGRYRKAEQYEEAVRRLETLRSEAPKRVRLELRAFTRSAATDLANRFAGVNDMLGDVVKRVDPAEQWSEIEATLHRVTNRALTEHLGFVRARAEAVVAELRSIFELEEGQLLVDLGDMGPAPNLAPELEDDLDFSTSKVGKAHDVMRGAVSTGFMGVGLATMVLTGGVGALALGAGAGLSTIVLSLRRDRTKELSSRRAKALQACRAWVGDARAALGTYADSLYKELEFRLESQIEKGLRALIKESETERARLDALRRVAAEKVPEEVKRVQGEVNRLRLVHAHARRLTHRLARPELQVVPR